MKIWKAKRILFAVAAVCMLTSCVGYRADQQIAAEPDPVALRLAGAVDRASTALQTLASIEQAKNPAQSIQSIPDAPQELRRTISLNWTGPIEPALRTLADRAGYQVNINGDRPPAPLVVSVDAREKSVVEVLRDLGLQAGRRADVVVDPERKMVELNYAPISGG